MCRFRGTGLFSARPPQTPAKIRLVMPLTPACSGSLLSSHMQIRGYAPLGRALYSPPALPGYTEQQEAYPTPPTPHPMTVLTAASTSHSWGHCSRCQGEYRQAALCPMPPRVCLLPLSPAPAADLVARVPQEEPNSLQPSQGMQSSKSNCLVFFSA